ncbi:E3 ubiquitin-protein ligase E3D [Bombus fervidus]|uniref:E3 ubiquitin-protein ligase E3D n=1 Tax=Bombus fervidus TaxID=203811 RepID=UPI003AB14574
MIESITLELRPRLQICNVFIHLNKKVNSTGVAIKLSKESIKITIENNTIIFLTKFVKLIPDSLSTLDITNNWICFRAQTISDPVFGSFKTQIITNPAFDVNSLKDTFKTIELFNTGKCHIMCASCKNILSKDMCIKRILPVPDMNYDSSEWFCCKHNHSNTMYNLIPSESDIFYGSLFFRIHASLFNHNLKIDENIAICNRCLQHLGKILTDNSLKLWNCAVDYNFLDNSESKTATDPFNDFLLAIKTSMTGIFGEEIILQCFVGKEIHSLILKPMDWHLNLMIEPKEISDDNIVTLKRISVVKVLYKYETNKNILDSVNKSYCEVSFLVIRAGLEHLLTSTKRFPQPHRTASDCYIGHICLENCTDNT